jgi:hypothetical protein
MPVRTNGGVFDEQMLTGSLSHFVLEGADFSGAINQFGQPVPFSAAEIIFTNISRFGYINIMNPNQYNLSFALEINRSDWDSSSITAMVRSLGNDVGVDHVDCTLCTCTEVPYIWDLGSGTGNYFSQVAVPSQPTINAGPNDTLTFIPGSNIIITTNASTKSVTINSTAGVDYIPVPSGTLLNFSTRYFVTGPFPVAPSPLAFVTLPLGTGSGRASGTTVVISKPADGSGNISFLVNTQGADIINTDIGTTNSIEVDATQEIIMVFDGVSTWNLQIGSVNL